LGDNPLELTTDELDYGPDLLRFQRDTSTRDTLPFLPYGTRLMQLCYVPRNANSISDLGLGQSTNPSFQVLWADTLVPEAQYVIQEGNLYLEGSIPRDTVRLTVTPVLDALVDTLACVNLTAGNFTGVNSFDLAVSWPEALRLDSYTFTTDLFPDANTVLLARTDTSARFGIQPEILSNYNVDTGTPILELCFAGELSDCNFYPIRVESQPETTSFLRKTADFTEGIPLPFILSSGYLEPLASESLELEMETVRADPDGILHKIKLHATNDLCVTEFPFQISYDEEEVFLIDISQANARTGMHAVRQLVNPDSESKRFVIEKDPAYLTDHFPAGEVATFTFRRRGDQDTVPILLDYDYIDSVRVQRADGKDFYFPASLTDGAFIFSDSTTSTSNWINSGGIELMVFPNPASDMLNVRGLPTSLSADAWVYDNLGRQVLYRQLNNGLVSLKRLSAGVYSLHIRQGSFSWVERFVVQ